MSIGRLSSARVAGVAVVGSIAGMIAGAALVLAATAETVGWLVFVLSFGGWLVAALLALREGWDRGWFDH